MYSLLREKASLYENALIQFAYELVSIPANHNFKEEIVGDKVISTMNSLGYDKAFRDSFGNVAGCIFGREYSPTLLLVSHMDTPDLSSVNSKISTRIDENNIYGLGASDSIGALAAQVFAGRLIKECIPLFGNIIVVGAVAELDGCSSGIRHFLKHTLPTLGLNASFAILGEPTNLGLYYCHDGWVCIELKIAGKCMDDIDHASIELYNFLNKSSANALSDSEEVEEIQITKPQILSACGNNSAIIKITHRLRNKNELLHLLCRFRETVRLVCRPYSSVSVSAGISRKVIQSKEGGSFTVRQFSLPWATDPLNPYFEEARLALRAASCEIRGCNLPGGQLGMSSAGNVLTDMYHIPTIGYGPGNEQVLQGSDDYMTIDNLKEAFYGTAVIANRITGMPSINKTEKNVSNYK